MSGKPLKHHIRRPFQYRTPITGKTLCGLPRFFVTAEYDEARDGFNLLDTVQPLLESRVCKTCAVLSCKAAGKG